MLTFWRMKGVVGMHQQCTNPIKFSIDIYTKEIEFCGVGLDASYAPTLTLGTTFVMALIGCHSLVPSV